MHYAMQYSTSPSQSQVGKVITHIFSFWLLATPHTCIYCIFIITATCFHCIFIYLTSQSDLPASTFNPLLSDQYSI